MISHTTTPRHQQGYGAVAPGKMLAAHNGTSEYNVDETADAIISNSNDPIWPGTRTYVPLFVMAGALVLAFYHIAASSSSFVGSIDIDNAQKGSLRAASGFPLLGENKSVHHHQRIPVIFDQDANYDDTLALIYLASNPLFDLKAVTTSGAGFATHHGGPINMQQVLQLFQKGSVPVSFGKPTSLSPISTFPLQWKIEIDEFFQKQDLPDTDTPLSVYDSDQLIAKVLRESDVAVAVIATGPATNLALALQNEPELIDRVSGLFLMGSTYGGGPNNVYDWQMTFNGVDASCSEDATTQDFTPMQKALTLEDGKGKAAIRPGCRGNSMSESGDTEWNTFVDVRAWHIVTRVVADAKNPPPVYVITSGSSEEMPITMSDFDKGVKDIKDIQKASFIRSLASAFLNAGEAKWWDAQMVVAMADIITNVKQSESVCSDWVHSTGFKVNLAWRKVEHGSDKKNPYGSITDVPGLGPFASFCRHGNVAMMQESYWKTIHGKNDGGTIADPSVYLRPLPSIY